MSDEKAVPVDPEAAAEAAEGAEVDDAAKLKTREAAEQDSALGKLTDRVRRGSPVRPGAAGPGPQ